MIDQELTPEHWLDLEDANARSDRIARLRWLADNAPKTKFYLFHGGDVTKFLFEETRYCFAYGQFLATIVLGLAFIENTLASLFNTVGRNDLDRANISRLLIEALNINWITETEYNRLEEIRKFRNPITHFRKPGGDDTIEVRAISQSLLPFEIIEEDAYKVMEIILHLLGAFSY